MIDVVVPYYRGIDYLKDCLAHMESYSECRIVLVKNSPVCSGDFDVIRRDHIRVIDLGGPVGYSRAVNVGVDKTKSDLVVLCDADVVVSNNWLRPHLEAHERFPSLGATSSLLINPRTGWVIDCGIAFFQHGHFHPFIDAPVEMVRTAELLRSPAVCSALMVVKRAAFNMVGGFDSEYHHYFQDVDFCLRLRSAGWHCAVIPQSHAYHHSRSSGVNTPAGRVDMMGFHLSRHRDAWTSSVPEFVGSMLDAFTRRHRVGSDYHWIDLSSLTMPEEFKRVFAKRFRLHDLTGQRTVVRDMPEIDLFSSLDYRALVSELPAIYFVDRFRSIVPNAYWRKRRLGRGDVVADRHGNILCLDAIESADPIAWPQEGSPP